jgi:pyruvate dehydrogenase E2 component (dihydrolipoamide acetyltransferase)
VPFEFRLADVGEGIHEVQLLTWRVKPGDEVDAFQPLCEVESAKATVELTSPVGGRVVEARVPEGAVAQVGEVLAVIEEAEQGWVVGRPPVRAAPLVRKLAREQGIKLEEVSGSGPAGRVRLADWSGTRRRITPLKRHRTSVCCCAECDAGWLST